MYDEKIVAQCRSEMEKGVEALKRGDVDTTSNHFWRALDCLADVQDDRIMRDELGSLASYYEHLGLFDLAMISARESIGLDKKLGLHRQLAVDIVTLGNVNLKFGNVDEAAKNYQDALKICLDNGFYDTAASASTNLACIITNQDRRQEAIALLYNSLDYLKKKAFPNTEKMTRLTLVQVLALEKENPAELIDVAEKLLKRFGHDIPRDYLNVIIPYINNAVQQYLEVNPDIDPKKWKLEHFPQLYK